MSVKRRERRFATLLDQLENPDAAKPKEGITLVSDRRWRLHSIPNTDERHDGPVWSPAQVAAACNSQDSTVQVVQAVLAFFHCTRHDARNDRSVYINVDIEMDTLPEPQACLYADDADSTGECQWDFCGYGYYTKTLDSWSHACTCMYFPDEQAYHDHTYRVSESPLNSDGLAPNPKLDTLTLKNNFFTEAQPKMKEIMIKSSYKR